MSNHPCLRLGAGPWHTTNRKQHHHDDTERKAVTLRNALTLTNHDYCLVSFHCSALPRSRGGIGFVQLLCAVVAAHLNRLATDLHLDGVSLQLAVTCRTSLFSHDLLLCYPRSG